MRKFVTTLITVMLVAFGVYYFLGSRNESLADKTRAAVSNIKGNLKNIKNEVSEVAKETADAVKTETDKFNK